jgi:hypothetical protein
MYRVKLNNENSEKITVGGIDITHRWKQINEKTKALEEIEKKGIIKIEEISKATWQGIEATEVRLGIYKENVNGMLAVNPIENETRGLLVKPPGNEIGGYPISTNANLIGGLAVNPIGIETRGLLVKPPGNEIGGYPISTNVNFIGGQIGISQAMNELNGIKVDFGVLASSLETKQGTCIIEQKPISTEPTEMRKTINDFKEMIEVVKTKMLEIAALKMRSDKNENIEEIKPDALKKADIKKITWVKTHEKLVFIIRQLSREGFLLDAESIGVDKMITNHFVTTGCKSFSKEENINRIRWVGALSQLVFLIDRFSEHNFLSKADIFEIDNLIYNHFGDREGNQFKKGSIKGTRNRIKNVNKNEMVKGGEKILEIIKMAENMKE